MKIIRMLWDAGFKAEMSFKANPKYLTQIQDCEAQGIPWTIVVGERELEQGVVKLHDVKAGKEKEDIVSLF